MAAVWAEGSLRQYKRWRKRLKEFARRRGLTAKKQILTGDASLWYCSFNP